MHQHTSIVVVWIVFVFGCAQVTAASSQRADLNITGIYTLSDDGSSTLEISAEETHYIAALLGGSAEAAGAAASADCYIRAVGKLAGRLLVAHFTPVETGTFMYSKTKRKKKNANLRLNLASISPT
jgi:hypothetical protein